MKSKKNTFILFVLLILSVVIGSQVWSAYSKNKHDANSYVTLVKGVGQINQDSLEIEKDYILQSGDKIFTGDSSLAVIKWGDGSLTRLSSNTKIQIEQNTISRDFSDIHISFELLAGKTWSQVVSFLGEGSSFTQSFNDIEAGVRGTVFDVDLESGFIRSSSHSVDLYTESGDIITLNEDEILNLESFSLVQLSTFIRDLEDRAWSELNTTLDGEYRQFLESRLTQAIEDQKSFFLFIYDLISPKYRLVYMLNTEENYATIAQHISDIPVEKYENVYRHVKEKYQAFNFIEAKNYEFYKRKLFYKRAMLSLSQNESEKKRLLESSAYDLQDMITSKTQSGLTETLSLLSEYPELVRDMELDFLEGSLDFLPQGLLQQFRNDFENLKNIFPSDMFELPSIPDFDIGEIKDTLDSGVQDFLDENVGGFLEGFQR